MINETHAIYALVILLLGACLYFSVGWTSEIVKSIDRDYCESVQEASWQYPHREVPAVDVETCKHYGIEL